MACDAWISVVLAFFMFHFTIACPKPEVCKCIQKTVKCNGTPTTNIDERAFLTILNGLPAGTEELVIQNGRVIKLTKDLLATASGKAVNALQRLSVISSHISKIEPLAFDNFVHLEYLDLSNNDIVPEKNIFQALRHVKMLKLNKAFRKVQNLLLPEGIFHRVETLEVLDISSNGINISQVLFKEVCANLEELDISGNNIPHLKNDTFKNCPKLTNLSIANTNMERLDDNAFRGLNNLTYLNLKGNKLQILSVANVQPVKDAAIHLEQNPWSCRCNFIYLVQWLRMEKLSLEIKCKWPLALSDKSLLTLSPQAIGCEGPKVTEVSKDPLTIFEGKNGTFVVEAIGLPYVDVDCEHETKRTNTKMKVSYRHSIHTDKGDEHHYTNIRIDFINLQVSDSGNITCVVKNTLGEDRLYFQLSVQKTDDGKRIDIVFFVTGILVFVITVALLIACLNIRNKKRAEKEAKVREMMELKGEENEAFQDVVSQNRRRDSIGYFPSTSSG